MADTGLGIVAADLPRIFDRFYRGENSRELKSDGFGLGLAIAKQITDLHGGTIDATSDIGHGTQLTVCLPRN